MMATWQPNGSMPLFEQVAAEIRKSIVEGEVNPGQRLPPARDFASVLGVNTNTVLRAIRQLRDEGVLEFRRGRGISVVGTPDKVELDQAIRWIRDLGSRLGYQPSELAKFVLDGASRN